MSEIALFKLTFSSSGTHSGTHGCYGTHMVPTRQAPDHATIPVASIIVREHRGQPFYEAKFRHAGLQVKRRIGPAWLERDDVTGVWTPRRGRVPDGSFDERRAHVKAAGIVAEYVTGVVEAERAQDDRRAGGATFRDVARDYLHWLEHVKGAKPATLRDHRSVLAEPGIPYRRGTRATSGHAMQALGDRPAALITSKEIEAMLSRIASSGAAPSTVNKYRARVSTVFNYGMRETTYALSSNPVRQADKRREPQRAPLVYYSPEELEALARQMGGQDSEIVRVAAYAGLRMGELLALRWRDVDFAGHALTISRAMSAGVESGTKSGRLRRVPLPDQAAAALDRLSRRDDFIDSGELVFVERARARPRRLGAAASVQARPGCGRPASAALPRPPAHVRVAAGGRRRGPRHHPGGNGAQSARNNQSVPPRQARDRAGRCLYASL